MRRGNGPCAVAGDSPFLPEALEANARGTLTEAQRNSCLARSRNLRWAEAGLGGLVIVLGLLFAATRHSSSVMPLRLAVLAGCLLIGAVLLWRALTGGDRLTADVRRGTVSSVDGAIYKRAVRLSSIQGASPKPPYYFDVAGQNFEVMWQSAFEAAPPAGYVRVFYLPRSRKAVNLERLPDPPVSQVTVETMQESAKDVLSALKSRNMARAAEAAAQLERQARYGQQFGSGPVTPPQDQPQARPLTEVIVGTWVGALMTVTFNADGSMTAGDSRARSHDGHWSVEADGRLRADALGQSTPTSAWVAGDELTIVMKGIPFTLHRSR